MSKLLFIDPGAYPAYTVVKDGVVLSVTLEHPGGHFDVVVVEGQYWQPASQGEKNKKSPQSMMTLSFTAGYQLGRTDADYFCVMKPKQWKGAVFRNGCQVKKEIFCARVYRRLLDDRLRAIVDGFKVTKSRNRQHDALDSLGMWFAYQKIDEVDLVFIKKIG